MAKAKKIITAETINADIEKVNKSIEKQMKKKEKLQSKLDELKRQELLTAILNGNKSFDDILNFINT